jgi:hypothetical protein
LIDVFLPTKVGGLLCTWPCETDGFEQVTENPIAVVEMEFNPYTILSLLPSPDANSELIRLESLKELHLLANDMLWKGAQQSRRSKRNPIGKMGSDEDLSTQANRRDGETIIVEDPKSVGLFSFPGADPDVINMGTLALGLFSQYGGNIDVISGSSPGASTARQTQALLQQISARTAVDREAYERFCTEVAQKLTSLAFASDVLQLEIQTPLPGTNITIDAGWNTPDRLPRPALLSDFHFETVPYSGALRTPEQRVQQLTAASQQFAQFMGLAATGAPINLEAVMRDLGEAFDLVPNLQEWWSGETPDPVEKATQSTPYTSTKTSTGSTVTHSYEGSGGGSSPYGGGGAQDESAIVMPQVGGMQ